MSGLRVFFIFGDLIIEHLNRNMNIDNIIVKVLMGEATATEIMEFVQWLNASEENQKEFEKIKAFWSIKSVSTSSISV